MTRLRKEAVDDWKRPDERHLADPHIQKVLRQGYALLYYLYPEEEEAGVRFAELTVRAVDDADERVAILNAKVIPEHQWIEVKNVEVDEGHRRKGIATALYVFAEALTGLPLRPSRDYSAMSFDAKAFWDQPDRPFGPKKAP